jgi:prophage regulatory protein
MTDEICSPLALPHILAGPPDFRGRQEVRPPEGADIALQVLRLPQVCAVTGLRRSMIYQLESEQRFPNRIKIGVRAVGWVEGEVRMWVAMRIAESRPIIRR